MSRKPVRYGPYDYRRQVIALMEERGVSQAELARGTRISKNTVCQFLGHTRGINSRKLEAMMIYLSKQTPGMRRSAAGGETA